MPEHVEAYPLHWPQAYPRTKRPKRSQFQTSFASARDGLLDELRLMEAKRPIISTNIPLRQDGLPYARFRTPDGAGVAVYCRVGRGAARALLRPLAEDQGQPPGRAEDGGGAQGARPLGRLEILKRTFSGFKSLPEEGTRSDGPTWWSVLGVDRSASAEEVKRAYRQRLHETHPDKDGDRSEFDAVQEAYRQHQQAA